MIKGREKIMNYIKFLKKLQNSRYIDDPIYYNIEIEMWENKLKIINENKLKIIHKNDK